YCKKPGHWELECRKKAADEKKGQDKVAYAKEINIGTVYAAVERKDKRSQLTFVIDSGATRHVVADRRWFSSYEATAGRVITTANGAKMPVLGLGTVTAYLENGQISIDGVAHVPSAVSNLLSVDRMVDEGFEVSFSGGSCRIARPGQSCSITATRAGGQYVVRAREASSMGSALT
ncbi:hypothetical protein V8E36_005064, partial [Tilletia maclaganii]